MRNGMKLFNENYAIVPKQRLEDDKSAMHVQAVLIRHLQRELEHARHSDRDVGKDVRALLSLYGMSKFNDDLEPLLMDMYGKSIVSNWSFNLLSQKAVMLSDELISAKLVVPSYYNSTELYGHVDHVRVLDALRQLMSPKAFEKLTGMRDANAVLNMSNIPLPPERKMFRLLKYLSHRTVSTSIDAIMHYAYGKTDVIVPEKENLLAYLWVHECIWSEFDYGNMTRRATTVGVNAWKASALLEQLELEAVDRAD